MIVNLSEQNSIANQFIAELRNVNIQTDRMRFRRNLERLGEVFAYEISKYLNYTSVEVETPLGIAITSIPDEKIVISSILRAGLPMHQGFLNVFDQAENAFISAYRQHHKDGTFEINLEYVSSPNLDDSCLIIADPMLATGASLDLTLQELLKNGQPSTIFIATAIASRNGLDYIRRRHPKVHIWMGALDEELTAKSYIVPGLGDAGDLSFGEKIQE